MESASGKIVVTNPFDGLNPLVIWDQVFETDPNYTKGFKKGGGLSGTSPNAMYLVRKATLAFQGPMGSTWGVRELETKREQGAIKKAEGIEQHEVLWMAKIELWYMLNGQRCSVEQWGSTVMVGSNKNGWFTDEDASKKSFTDGMTKCMSLLGFSGDIFLGLYDDNKYVEDMREKYAGHGGGQGGGGRQQGQGNRQQGGYGQQRQNDNRQQQGSQQQNQQQQAEREVPLLSMLEFKARVDAGIQLNEALPLIGKLHANSAPQGQASAGYLVDKKLSAANDERKLNMVMDRVQWMAKRGWLSEVQVTKFTADAKQLLATFTKS